MSPRVPAADRLRRVLALVPYIAAHQGVSIAELAGVFGVEEAEIEADLEILPFCGLPPYTPDRLMDVAIGGGTVSIRFAEYFSRPLRLTPAEGFALLAAGRALLAVPGSDAEGPLGSALAKLEEALGSTEVLAVDVGAPEHLARLREAAGRRERLEIDYYSFGRDAVTTRRVDPYDVSTLRGRWYVAAYCHQAQDDRLFRVDRIQDIRETGEHFEPPAEEAEGAGASGAGEPHDVFHPAPGDTRVVLDLPRSAGWVVEAYPTEEVRERRGGGLRVTLAVSARPWLERLLLALGPKARVVEPEEWRGVQAAAAQRLLARYR